MKYITIEYSILSVVKMKVVKIKESERRIRKKIHKKIKVDDDWPESYNEWLIY
jgi:hypothetical protein